MIELKGCGFKINDSDRVIPCRAFRRGDLVEARLEILSSEDVDGHDLIQSCTFVFKGDAVITSALPLPIRLSCVGILLLNISFDADAVRRSVARWN
jgi:hypothetical protein